jgi:hypothetical protein
LVGKLKGLFGGAASSADSSDTESSGTAVPSPSPSPENKKQQGKDKDLSTINLKVIATPLSIHPLTFVEKGTARER